MRASRADFLGLFLNLTDSPIIAASVKGARHMMFASRRISSPPIADIIQRLLHVSFGPEADSFMPLVI
jgi:hypothetical protein